MKILFLSHAQYVTVGLPKIIEQAETLAEQGHYVTVVATSKINRIKIKKFVKNNVHYVLSPSLMWGKLRHGADLWDAFRRSIYLIKNFDFDVVHCIDSRPTVILPGLLLKKMKQATLIIEWSDLYSEGGTINERSSWLYRATLGKIESFFETKFRLFADGSVVITKFLKNKLMDLGYNEKKILIHRMGGKIDDGKIMLKNKARKFLRISENDIIIGHLGRIYARDLKLLIDSYKIAKHKIEKLKIYLIGNIEEKDRIKEDGVIYTGYVDNKTYNAYCNAVDFFILPLHISIANLARWPSKVGDYVSYGKPVITTKVSDIEEIFRDYEIGVLAEDASPEKIADAILEAVESDKYFLWSQKALLFAKEKLDWYLLNNELINFYEKIRFGIV